jgi:sialic acid synthase SpsE
MKSNEILVGNRKIGDDHIPFVICEIGINHNGEFQKAKQMIHDAYESGAECVKFQSHVVEDEMIENDIVPVNAHESIWNMMKRCSFSEEEEISLKKYVEELGMIYLCTPFSREAVNRLERMNVLAYKIGSGECNNLPLLNFIASKKKPVLLSTGMNDIESIKQSVDVLEKYDVSYALLHTTSLYPTPYEKVRLGAISDLRDYFPNAVLGLSDHSFGNYTCFAAVSLGCSILEKHFTSDKNWPGPDIPVSINPSQLKDLIQGSNAIHKALGGKKDFLSDEKVTSNFAFACVVSISDIKAGDYFSYENLWAKRPGTGSIDSQQLEKIINKKAKQDIKKGIQLEWNMIEN